MIFSIAWRNIWRSRTRSLIVIGAVLVGVWSFIMMTALTLGMTKGYIDNAIRFQTSHLQLHHPKYVVDNEIKYQIDHIDVALLSKKEEVAVVARRILVNGMVKSSRSARGVTIRGVVPTEEEALTSVSEKIIEGNYFSPNKKNQILLSQEIADRLKLKVRKKLVLQFQNIEGDIVASSFRVIGIYKTGNRILDLTNVIVKRKDLMPLVAMEEANHEIVIKLNNPKRDLYDVQNHLQNTYPNVQVDNYRTLAPDVELYETQIYISMTVLLVIFMLALIFGIVNTMLMAVLERTKEIGMLMAIGMNKSQVFFMIVIETMLLGFIGAPLGLLVGGFTVKLFNRKGIDLGGLAEGAERFGIPTVIRPFMESQLYIQLMVAVFITALLASIYPALRAIRLEPIEAIRKI